MDIKTKLNIGDKVVGISHCQKETFKTCSTCEGLGKIEIKGKEFNCPDCYGEGGNKEYQVKKWYIVTDEGILSSYDKIVKIDIDVTKKEIEIRYMLGQRYSGSYSGTLWHEDDLFRTKDEAELECKRRNKELENIE
jgi:RecJ-like exonuclease